jgi:signal transduction histidine kinase
MVSSAFGHRSGRVIASLRVLLITAFAAALFVDPTARSQQGTLAWFTAGYAVVALAILLLTWNSWLRECRFAFPIHLLDIVAAIALIASTGGYYSPFLGFSVFVIFTAAIRWPSGHVAVATLGTILVAGALLQAAGVAEAPEFGAVRYVTRAATLIILALLILWFSRSRSGSLRAGTSSSLLDEAVSSELPIRQALEFAAGRLGASNLVLVWADSEEPWLQVAHHRSGVFHQERVPPAEHPDLLDSVAASQAFLFDCRRGRVLAFEGTARRVIRAEAPIPCGIADVSFEQGAAIPIRTSRHEALLIAGEINGLCSDDLPLALSIGDQISAAFERAVAIAARRQSSQAEARLGLARDIHDGAIQFLAGLGLRIRVIKREAGNPQKVLDALAQVECELQDQQKDLRDLIDQLREPAGGAPAPDLYHHIVKLARLLAAQWQARINVTCDQPLLADSIYPYQIDQLIREAVSNAVRHGAAANIEISSEREDRWLRLSIADDGGGFAFDGSMTDSELWAEALGPRSIHERVRRRGGSMAVHSSSAGSTVDLRLPLEPQE